ncbi:hypothetical protein DJ031_06830 [bacterium endosymbiont of Escarpia laminata]|nr:MAG: hypothetical protein DJ031_06830 [bacterium endosymbiont of Escarpia laminata]
MALSMKNTFQRNGDMTPPGESILRLTIQDDGDVIIAIDSTNPLTEKPTYATIEFCEPGQGGGKSSATWTALHNLAAAMERDSSR